MPPSTRVALSRVIAEEFYILLRFMGSAAAASRSEEISDFLSTDKWLYSRDDSFLDRLPFAESLGHLGIF